MNTPEPTAEPWLHRTIQNAEAQIAELGALKTGIGICRKDAFDLRALLTTAQAELTTLKALLVEAHDMIVDFTLYKTFDCKRRREWLSNHEVAKLVGGKEGE